MKKIKSSQRGYTLIEIIVVISIIGFVLSTSLYSLTSARLKGRDAKRLTDIEAIKKTLQLVYSDNNGYPGANDTTWYHNDNCVATTPTALDLGSLLNLYINTIPDDPIDNDTGCYWYQRKNSGTGFILLMKPENQNIVNDGIGCATAGVPSGNTTEWYCVGDNFN